MQPLKNSCRSILLSLLFGCILIFFVGCSGTEVGNPDAPRPYPSSNDLNTFVDNQELETYLKNQYAKNVVPSRAYNSYGTLPAISENDLNHPDFQSAGDQGNGKLLVYSRTNVQEAGVDESDKIKTNGQYIYIAKGNGVRVVEVGLPGTQVAAVQVDGYTDTLYLYNDLLVILYVPTHWEGEPWDDDDDDDDGDDDDDDDNDNDDDDDDEIDLPDDLEEYMDMAFVGLNYRIPVNARTGIAFYNMADPVNPVLLNAVEVDGYLVSSRKVERKLHLIQQYLPDLPPIRFWYDEEMEDFDEIFGENLELLEDLELEDLIPFYVNLTMGPMASGQYQAVLPGRCYRPGDDEGGGSITTVLTFDLDQPELPFDSVGIIADAHNVYASADALYVVSDRWRGRHRDKDAPVQQTEIYKFDLTGEAVTPAGSGRVNGWILNQFSMGEFQDVLRIATTTTQWNGRDRSTSNQVYCLSQNADKLEVVGALEDIAPGERLYSARFIGERGFLVTFERIDPLFTLDLSDPLNPRIAGELKVPGYADYIHPWGDNYLITLGKEVISDDKNTWVQGLQLSIFDITNFASPVLLHQIGIGDRGTHSEALFNHKAFTFMPDKQLMALPVDLYTLEPNWEKPWLWGEYASSGLHVFRLSVATGFEELGIIPTKKDNMHWLPSKWSRGVFIESNVHAVTSDAVHSAVIEDIENTIQTLNLKE